MYYITYPSALDFWLNGTGRQDLKQPYIYEDFNPIIAESRVTESLGIALPAPVAIMVPSRNSRRTNGQYKYIPASPSLPYNCFVRIRENVCVASPELCFLMAARDYPLSQHVELGNCLCAGYVFDANRQYGQRSRYPITCSEKIRDFVMHSNDCFGFVKSAIAVKYIRDGSGSPMENRMAAIFFLSKSHGGFKYKDGELNGSPVLTKEAYRILGCSQCRGDFVWNESRAIGEYDSSMSHENADQLRADARRQTAMNMSGYTVVRFTKESVLNFAKFEEYAMALWKNIGMGNKTASLEKYRQKRMSVFKELFLMKHDFFQK